MRTSILSRRAARSLIAAACVLTCLGAQAATIKITSRDAPGTGFDDPTPVAPVGGNPGTTLGQQRWNVYQYVASIWEKNIDSDIVINVSAAWEPLTCTSSSAVLGSAQAWNIWHDFAGGQPGTWYPQALANKLAHTNLSAGQADASGYDNADIKTQFNSNLGNPGCLDNNHFYLGLDGKAGNDVNFVETLLHELGHGLGFAALTNTSAGYRIDPTGAYYVSSGGLPSVWEQFMYDNTAGKTWLNMTNKERAASAVNNLQLAWNGKNAVAGATAMLTHIPIVQAASPAPGGNRNVDFATATFGPLPPASGVLGVLANVATQAGEIGPGCSVFNAANATAVKGKVAIISRGGCTFVQKVKNAQDAGAVAVLLANNSTGIQAPGGVDPTITIPSVGISQADGDALKASVTAAIPYGSRTKPGGVTVSLTVDPVRTAGADLAGRPLLYTPATLAPGSSVSHWDVSASPNLLMEPNINPDLTTTMVPPYDLTLPVMKDIGW